MSRGLETSSNPLEHKPFSRLGAIVHIAMLLAEITIEDPKSAEDTIKALPEDVLKKLQLDNDWLRDHIPDVSAFTDAAM